MVWTMTSATFGIEGGMSRPFRAKSPGSRTQGVALGWYVSPFQGVERCAEDGSAASLPSYTAGLPVEHALYLSHGLRHRSGHPFGGNGHPRPVEMAETMIKTIGPVHSPIGASLRSFAAEFSRLF